MASESGEAHFVDTYRGMWQRFRRVIGAQLLATMGLILMAITIVGLPFAAWKYVGWLERLPRRTAAAEAQAPAR